MDEWDIQNNNSYREIEELAKKAFKEGQYDKAFPLFEMLCKTASYIVYYEKAGECLIHLNRYYEALTYLFAAAGRAPKQFRAYYLAACAFQKIGDTERAAEYVAISLTYNPDFKQAVELKNTILEIDDTLIRFREDE